MEAHELALEQHQNLQTSWRINMSYYLEANDELSALHDLLDLILQKGTANGNYQEVLSCLLTIHFDPFGWKRYIQFRDDFLVIGGEIAKKG
jgi:hypothetical protein